MVKNTVFIKTLTCIIDFAESASDDVIQLTSNDVFIIILKVTIFILIASELQLYVRKSFGRGGGWVLKCKGLKHNHYTDVIYLYLKKSGNLIAATESFGNIIHAKMEKKCRPKLHTCKDTTGSVLVSYKATVCYF